MTIPSSSEQAGGGSLRARRVAEGIKELVGTVVTQELADPRLGFVTVTGVKVSPDLREARVFVSILGSEAERNKTMRALAHAAGFVKRRCGDELRLRYTPNIRFEFDTGVDKSIRLSELLYSDRPQPPDQPLPPLEEEGEEAADSGSL